MIKALFRAGAAGLLGLVLAGSLSAPLHAQDPAPEVQLTLEEARALATRAVREGNFGLAIQIARNLIKADNRDPIAYFVLALAHGATGDAYLSRRAAGYAYRYSTAPEDKLQAGQLAARAALAENRYSLAQIWLRRSAIHAQGENDKAQVARDYGALRRLNPWSLRINGSLRPSSNVNNGSEDSRQLIEGVPVTGFLSGTAQALSGVIGELDTQLTYRLNQSANAATFLGARIFSRHVALSSGAQAIAPGASNSDFSSQYAEISLRHRMQFKGGAAGAGLAFGQAWYGGTRTYRLARLSLDRSWGVGDDTILGLATGFEKRRGVHSTRFDATAISLSLRAARQLQNGDRLNLTLGLRDTDATFQNDQSQSVSLRTGYSLANQIGPATLDLGLTLGYSDYDNYRAGFIPVPGGRQDKSIYADVNLTFEDWDYAGFSPSLRIRAGRTTSNDSRFTTRELSIGLGIASNF